MKRVAVFPVCNVPRVVKRLSPVFTSVYERVSQISAIYLFLCVFYAILRCKSFKIRIRSLIELLKIYENMVLTSFLDLCLPPFIRISLILHQSISCAFLMQCCMENIASRIAKICCIECFGHRGSDLRVF